MKVKMIASMGGPNVHRNPGDILEIPDDEAQRLIDKGYAVPVT